MKKIRYIASPLIIICLVLCMFFSACTDGSLEVPHNIRMDENYVLSWSGAEDATGYTVRIENVDTGVSEDKSPTHRTDTSYDLSSLAEGDYTVMVRSDGAGNRHSKWSEEFYFHRDYESGCLYTSVNNGTECELTGMGTANGDVVMEDYYRGKPVTSVGDAAFRGRSALTGIVLGKYVRSIGTNAFYNCTKLEYVVLPDGLETIGSGAFQSCRVLTEINLPEGVTEISGNTFAYCRALGSVDLTHIGKIGDSAFKTCEALTEVDISDSVSEMGESVFYGCKALEKVRVGAGLETLPESTFSGDTALKEVTFAESGSLKDIETYAFYGCENLENIALPEGLETIGEEAFRKCSSLADVSLPSTVTKISQNAFADTALYESQEGDDFVYAGDWVIGCNIKTEIETISENTFKSGTVGIADWTFGADSVATRCVNLDRPNFSYTIKYIGDYAFYNCTAMHQLSFADDGVLTIGSFAFANCSVLQSINLGNKLVSIGDYAFYGDSYMQDTPRIPGTVTSVGRGVFMGTNIPYDDDGLMVIGSWVVGSDSSAVAGDVTLDDSVTGIADYAFSGTAIAAVVGLSRVEHLGKGAFFKCSSLQNVTLNSSLTEIGDYTFYKCSSLLTVTNSSAGDVASIGRSAFYKCESLYSCDLSNFEHLAHLGEFSFYGCIALTDVTFWRYLEDIGHHAFYLCDNLADVDMSECSRLTSIGMSAFGICPALETVAFPENGVLKEIDGYAFTQDTSLGEIVLPDSVETIGEYAFFECGSAEKLYLGKSLKSIGEYAFCGDISIPSVAIPATTERIERYAFAGCSGVTSVTMSADIKYIAEHAFNGMTSATFYVGGDRVASDWNPTYNSSYRPVVWKCTLSEDGEYVVSVTVDGETFGNMFSTSEISAPQRDGYEFSGWAVTEGGAPVYAAGDIPDVPAGTTLYAVWTEIYADIP